MRTLIKILIALALVGVYWASGGLDPAKERYLSKLHGVFFAVYVSGLLCALCEGDEDDTYSTRPIFIIVGSILMIIAFCAMRATKTERQSQTYAPNHSIQQTETSRSEINPIQPHWRLASAADADRWATGIVMARLFLLLLVAILLSSCSTLYTELVGDDKPRVLTPTIMKLSIGGPWSQSFEVTYDGRKLHYYSANTMFNLKSTKPVVIRPSDNKWDKFLNSLDNAKVWTWERDYQKRGSFDGTFWKAIIVYQTNPKRDLIATGNNAYPAEFDNFLAAVRDLVGNEFR